MATEIRDKIADYCRNRANEINILKYSRYFKEGLYDGFGLTASQINDGAKKLAKLPDLSLRIMLDTIPDIIKTGKYEEISIAMLIVKKYHKEFSKETFRQIALWYKYGINNWAHADTLGMIILPVFLQKEIINVTDFAGWLKSQNKFQRRSVPVTLIKILKMHQDIKELFAFIECLMTDPEREVHQGTGWFLREAWKKYPAETEEFLTKWKDEAPRLIYQYATEKMTPEAKTRFKKQKLTANNNDR